MRSSTSGLTTRQFERETTDLDVEFIISPDHRAQVCFSPTSTAADPHTIRGRMIDVSSGGMGLVLRGFLPRMCEGTVRVFHPQPSGRSTDGEPIYDVTFEHDVKVRRVTMHDRSPSYSIGLAFLDPEPDIEDRVNRLLDVMKEAGRIDGVPSDGTGQAQEGEGDA